MVVRTDECLAEEDADTGAWKNDPVTNRSDAEVERYELPSSDKATMSLSGHERNKLFLKCDKSFVDSSAVSGLDSPLDGRNIAVLDFNRDGFADFLVGSMNGQSLKFFANRVGHQQESTGNFVVLKLVGGAKPDLDRNWSNRDAVGARVIVQSGEQRQLREVRCGEGFATQNSQNLLVGMGSSNSVDITVLWPSGQITLYQKLPTGKLHTIFEDESEIDNDNDNSLVKGVVTEEYSPIETDHLSKSIATGPKISTPRNIAQLSSLHDSEFHTVTTMATWCIACKKQLAQLELLKQRLGDRIQMHGLPVDSEDTDEKLLEYVNEFEPAYKLVDYQLDLVNNFRQLTQETIDDQSLPCTLLLDRQGNLIKAFQGVPTVSQLTKACNTAASD